MVERGTITTEVLNIINIYIIRKRERVWQDFEGTFFPPTLLFPPTLVFPPLKNRQFFYIFYIVFWESKNCNDRIWCLLWISALWNIVSNIVLREVLLHYSLMKMFLYQRIKISYPDVPSLSHFSSTDQSFLYFPALCSVDKGDIAWPPHLQH